MKFFVGTLCDSTHGQSVTVPANQVKYLVQHGKFSEIVLESTGLSDRDALILPVRESVTDLIRTMIDKL